MWFKRLALMVVGLGLAGLIILILFWLFPDLYPQGPRFIFREWDGDTFHHQPGMVRPSDENRVLEDFIRRTDADGFRLPRRVADHYPIIVLGDSFTEGGQVPWVDVLAERLDQPIRNLAWRGFGPLHYVEVMRQYGRADHEWVLLGYFEGNDLSNIQTAYQEQQNTGVIDIARRSEVAVATRLEPVRNPDNNYLYPLRHEINGREFEMAYISDYLWWLNGSQGAYAESQNIELLWAALGEIKSLAGEACSTLVYLPSKEHIYFRYADPQGNRRYVLENGLNIVLNHYGWIDFEQGVVDYEDLAANWDHQRDVVQDIALRKNWLFFDLTPVFEEAALNSPDLLYYVYDSHLSAAGHELAGRAVAEMMRAAGCDD